MNVRVVGSMRGYGFVRILTVAFLFFLVPEGAQTLRDTLRLIIYAVYPGKKFLYCNTLGLVRMTVCPSTCIMYVRLYVRQAVKMYELILTYCHSTKKLKKICFWMFV